MDNRAQTFAQAFSHSLHGNIVSKSKSKPTIKALVPQPSAYDRMIDDTLSDHGQLQPGIGTGCHLIAHILYGNIRMLQPSPAGDCLAASTAAKDSILQDYNAKFCGPSG